MVKNPPTNAGDIRDMGSIPGLGRSPGEELERQIASSSLSGWGHGLKLILGTKTKSGHPDLAPYGEKRGGFGNVDFLLSEGEK